MKQGYYCDSRRETKAAFFLTLRHICIGQHFHRYKYRCSHSHHPRIHQVCAPHLCRHMKLQRYKITLFEKNDYIWCWIRYSLLSIWSLVLYTHEAVKSTYTHRHTHTKRAFSNCMLSNAHWHELVIRFLSYGAWDNALKIIIPSFFF